MMRTSQARRGATMVAVAILTPVLFIMAAMVINLAYIQVVKTKTQIVTDAAARSAGRVYAETGDEELALQAAQQMAAFNPINKTVVSFDATDLEFGLTSRNTKNKRYTFTPATQGNAVRVQTRSFANGAGPALEPLFPTFGASVDIRPLTTATNSQTTLDVAVVLDRSGSMAFAANESSRYGLPAAAPPGWDFGGPVPPNCRWLDLVAAVESFCNELSLTAKEEQVGVVSYAGTASHDITMTTDYGSITDHNKSLSAAFPGGATNVGEGILLGVEAVTEPSVARPWATNAVVLMSDGQHNTGTDPITAAQQAVDQSIPIYTVSFSTEADHALMQKIANMTGGTHYHAETAEQLNQAFRDIARRLPSILTE